MSKDNMYKQQFFWLSWLRRSQSNRNLGFSIVEKLVSLVIASLITTGLVSLITQFIQSDQQEAAFLATERDTQIALDYITEDLREAVFVYEEITPLLIDSIPDFKNLPELGPNTDPILIFWKTEPVPEDEIPVNCSYPDELKQRECELLQIKRHVYTLVVYVQSTDPHDKWLGRSRIVRYALPKYVYTGPGKLPEESRKTIGFVDPAEFNNFVTWPKDKNGNNQQQQRPNPAAAHQPQPMVLVDFIDSPDRSEFQSETKPDLPPPPEPCPDSYARVPASVANFNSFYTCVRKTSDEPGKVKLGANQDIIVYLRGNADNRDNLVKTKDHIPTLQARVTLRGVIDKYGNN